MARHGEYRTDTDSFECIVRQGTVRPIEWCKLNNDIETPGCWPSYNIGRLRWNIVKVRKLKWMHGSEIRKSLPVVRAYCMVESLITNQFILEWSVDNWLSGSISRLSIESSLLLFRSLRMFVLSTTPQFTQLYNWVYLYLAIDSGGNMIEYTCTLMYVSVATSRHMTFRCSEVFYIVYKTHDFIVHLEFISV